MAAPGANLIVLDRSTLEEISAYADDQGARYQSTAIENHDNQAEYDTAYALGARDVLDWLVSQQPTVRLAQLLNLEV